MGRSSYAALVIAAVSAVIASACGSSSSSKTGTGGSGGIGNSGGGPGGSSGGAAGSKSGTGGSGGIGNSSGGGGGSGGAAGGKSGTGGASGSSSDGGPTDAAVPTTFPFPTVSYQDSPLMTAPKVVTITFPGDAMASQLDSFGSTATSTAYWDTVRAGYCGGGSCIGDGPAGVSVALATAPAVMYTDSTSGGPATLQTFLASLITANTVPAPDANTIYAMYFPSTTTIKEDGGVSCQDFLGYHNAMTMGSQTVYFAVIPECPSVGMTPPITLLQNTTLTASHEIIETATDGSSQSIGFFLNLNDPATWGWNDAAFGGEVADLCVDQFGLDTDETTENGFTVQRVWSLANAAAGKNPCVPIPAGEVYFNTFTQYSVVVMAVGASKTFDVHALADGPMSSWTVNLQDWSGGSTPYLKFSIPGGTSSDAGSQIKVQSGDTFQLTVTLLADPTNSPNGEADGVVVSANGSSAAATVAHYWPFIVLSTREAQNEGVMMELQRRHAQAKGPGRRSLQRTLP